MIWQKRFTKHFTDTAGLGRKASVTAVVLSALLAGCGLLPGAKEASKTDKSSKPSTHPEAGGSASGAKAPTSAPKVVKLAPPATQRSWAAVREQAAKRLVAANPDMSYTGEAPDVLLAIPVLSIDLNADGSVRRIEVMRHPSQAKDTVQLAMQAVRRAAPYGDVSRLPKPWRFSETFLFNDDRKFKPMTLDRK